MISRRNIRVKVMQTLYTVETSEQTVPPAQLLESHLQQTCQLFVYLVHLVTEVARYAEIEARQRASKHLATEEDLRVNLKSAGNELLWRILED